MMLSRRNALRLGVAGVVTALPGCRITTGERTIAEVGLSKEPTPGREVNIELYNLWGGTTGQGWVDLATEYERQQDRVGIRINYAPASGTSQQKLFTAIAGDQAPDIAHIVPMQTGQWSALGIMTDLTPYFEADGLTSDDFLAPVWKDMTVDGRIWQLQWVADPNFPFFWNKDLFEASGLDPDTPPTTVDEIDEMSDQILKKSGGRVTQIGIIPWNQYGMANSVFTWGWTFGGDFFDPDTGEVTPDNEYVVKALEWIVRFAKRVGGADNVSVAPPGVTLHYFSTGNVGMSSLVAPNYAEIRTAKPDLTIGDTLWPYQPPGGTEPGNAAWVGGWSAFVPKGSRHPQDAWDFIRWLAASDEGTQVAYDRLDVPPAYQRSPALSALRRDETLSSFYDVLFAAKHSRPAMQVADFYAAQLDEQASRALYGELTPYQALRKVKEDTQDELERFLRELRP